MAGVFAVVVTLPDAVSDVAFDAVSSTAISTFLFAVIVALILTGSDMVPDAISDTVHLTIFVTVSDTVLLTASGTLSAADRNTDLDPVTFTSAAAADPTARQKRLVRLVEGSP
jgi:hypothetical protein